MPARVDDVFRPLLRSRIFERLVESARGETPPLHLSGLTESSKALFLLLLRREIARPILLVTPDDRAFEEWRRDLAAFSRIVDPGGRLGRVVRFPALDADPYLGLPPHFEVSCERVVALHRIARGEASFVVAPVRALINPLPAPGEFASATVVLGRGSPLDQRSFFARLVEIGYRRVDVVGAAGEWAARGGIIDVFSPAEETPVRIELSGDEVESIRSFDPDSQRSLAPLDETAILPVAEVPMDRERRDRLAATVEAQSRARFPGTGEGLPAELATERWRALLTGEPFQGVEGCAGLALVRPVDLFAHLGAARAGAVATGDAGAPGAAFPGDGGRRAHHPKNGSNRNGAGFFVALDEPDRTDEELESVFAELAGSREETSGPLPPPEELFLDRHRVSAGLAGAPIRLSELRVGDSIDDAAVVCQPTRNYSGRVPEWRRDLDRHRQDGRRVLLLLNTPGTIERTSELLTEAEIPFTLVADSGTGPPADPARAETEQRGVLSAAGASGPRSGKGDGVPEPGAELLDATRAAPVFLMLGHLNHGFVLPDLGIALFAERELYGEEPRPRQRRRRRGAAFVSDFRDLRIGDPVVHVDHGIGRYEGLHRMGGAGAQRDFMLVTYEEGGKLYVPVDRLDLVQKYGVSGEARPKLDRLGGTGWERRRRKVTAAVEEMTAELLQLYAKRKASPGRAFSSDTPWQREFEDAFPYVLTPDQERAIAEVKADMESDRAMDRLLCGDVGFGKTEVAMRAAFKAIQDGCQVAVLAPTTVLTLQHLNTFRARFAAFPVTVEMVSRFRSAAESREILSRVAAGSVDILIGTHRLLSKDVTFRRLGLLIVDEEQRFGVAHKERLKKMSEGVDVLTLTATPIPRTLQMSLAGVRDMSMIETPPQNRLAIQTNLVPYKRGLIASAIRNELRRGGQVYFVHNRVETLDSFASRLRELVPEARIAVAHGQMDRLSLERVMTSFLQGDFDILVSTTIIENGLDLPRVNTLFVNRADHFGLAQLYQLRGRIGRSDQRAYAYFIIPGRMALSAPARRRLVALQEFSELGSGFRLAAMDLEIRGAGELLGARQHGHIAALGFDMYVQILERAVREMQGEPAREEEAAQISLGVDFRLPESYVPEPSLRLAFYKRVSSAEDETDLNEIRAEIVDRFGELPVSGVNLFRLAALRLGAMRLGVRKLDVADGSIALQFGEPPRLDSDRIVTWIQRTPGARLTPTGVLRAPLPAGADRIEAARAVVVTLLELMQGAG